MKKLKLLFITVLLSSICSVAFAGFELNKNEWTVLGSTSTADLYYNSARMEIKDDTAKVWICSYIKSSGAYRLIQKKYTKGNDKAVLLKQINYHNDGTYKSGSAKVVENVPIGNFEMAIVSRLW